MAILNKITPASVTATTAAIELILTYDSAETPWAKANIYFYNLNGEIIEAATMTNVDVTNGKINTSVTMGTLTSNTKYLVTVGKPETETKTNSRVLLLMTQPTISDLLVDQTKHKVSFTYTPTYIYEPLYKYQFSITDKTNANSPIICEISDLFVNSQESGAEIVYYYSSYLEPGHSYKFSVTTYSKSGLIVVKDSADIVIPSKISYDEKPALIPIKPIITKNEEYGCIKISIPKEIIKPCSVVSLVSGNYGLSIPNCYGCDSTKERTIYPSLSLQNGIKADSTTNVTVGGPGLWRLSVPADLGTLTETCCVGFAPKGNFKLLKETRSGEFEELTSIVLPTDQNYVYEDYMVHQGYEYNYYLVPSGEGLSSGAVKTPARAQWDSIILSDVHGKILTIQYNPQVSSFKTTILEQKQETLGGKYPFFLRNGDCYYKEIPLSGLISYAADPSNKFQATGMSQNAAPATRTRTQVYQENWNEADEFYLERNYKRQVEEWLNNGEPKLLRTAAEGSFIVRLMNVSLSPMQQLGRKLHTFSATAYEIADYNFTNLQKYGLNNLNTAPSSTTPGSNITGTVVSDTVVMTIENLPYGLGEETYKIIINQKFNNRPTHIRFKNNSNQSVTFVTNAKYGSTSVTVNAASTSELIPIWKDSISMYVLSKEAISGAKVELLCPSAKLGS